MTDQANSAVGDQEVLIASGTIAFHNAFEPKPFMRNGQAVGAAYYNVTMLYDASVLEDAKTLAVSVAKEKWGDIKGVRFPFLKGEVEAKKAVARAKAKGKTNYEKAGDFYGDSIVMKAKTQYEVPVYDMNGKEMLSQKDLYSGAIATILIKFVANEISETNPETGEPNALDIPALLRRHTMTIDTLGEWMGAVLVTGAKKTEDPDAPLNFGSWCRYCPAQSVKHCSKIKARVDSIMNGAAYGAATEQATTEAAASLMDEWEIAEQLDLEKVVQHHFKLLKDEAFKRMMNGGHIPGRKIVMGKTNRVWKDGAVNKIKKMLGKDAFTDPKLKSPSQIEKTGKPGKALAAELAFKPKGALTMAPIDDTRNAVQPRDIGALLNSV